MNYNKEYYEANKQEILSKRRLKYAQDKAYRTKVNNSALLSSKIRHLAGSTLNPIIYIEAEPELSFSLYQITKCLKESKYLSELLEHGCIPAAIVRTVKCEWFSESQARLLIVASEHKLPCDEAKKMLSKFWFKKYNRKEVSAYVKEIECAKKTGNQKAGNQKQAGKESNNKKVR
jgi:hypothetical protein